MPSTVATSTSSQGLPYPCESALYLASDGTALVLFFDGSHLSYATASSPYTSWTTANLAASIANPPVFGLVASGDGIDGVDVFYLDGVAVPYYVHLTKSGSTWTASGATQIAAAPPAGATQFMNWPAALAKDSGGTYWLLIICWTGSTEVYTVYYSSTPGVAGWSVSLANQSDLSLMQEIGLGAVGADLLIVNGNSDGANLAYRRRATTDPKTTWAAKATTPAGCTLWHMLPPAPVAGSIGMVGIAGDAQTQNASDVPTALTYQAGGIWGSGTKLGASASDDDLALATDGTTVYALWCGYAAANNYSIRYAKYAAGAWGAATQLEASGANRQRLHAAATSSLLAWAWIEGTASPYNVQFDSLSLGGSTPVSGSDSATDTDSATLAAAIAGADSANLAQSTTYAAALAGADAGTLAQTATYAAAVGAGDSGSLSDSGGATASAAATDAASLTDAATVTVTLSAADAATFADSASASQGGGNAVGASDSAMLTEGATVTVTLVATDGGVLADLAATTVSLTGADAAAAIESAAIALAVADSGAVTDAALLATAVAVTAPASLLDTATYGATLATADAGSLTDSAIAAGVSALGTVAGSIVPVGAVAGRVLAVGTVTGTVAPVGKVTSVVEV